MPAIQPMEQFLVKKVVDLPPLMLPGIGPVDMSITNSVLVMLVAAGLMTLFFLLAAKRELVPGRLQAAAEMLYNLVDGTMTGGIIGDRSRPFLPFVFTLFMFILTLNILGLVPGGFSVTSQLAITATLAAITISLVLVVGFARNGLGFFKLFLPAGMPLPMAMMIAPVEFISFAVRPMTLAMRLFGNMLGGHAVTYMFGAFVVGMGIFGLEGAGLAKLGLAGSAVSFAVIIPLLALEFVVAFLQAFVFAVLTCVYLTEVVNLDHGH
ncbi:MAG TPA: F0F1 ATP synthase subunit A [Caulobacteraceae bacterium]|nr:F0F1 ATP synthase subunit A [Caulobacteraceae bacterium]